MGDSGVTDRAEDGGRDATAAGTSLILAGAIAYMGIITAEVLYPDYSTRQDISHLGSTIPPIRSSTNPLRCGSSPSAGTC